MNKLERINNIRQKLSTGSFSIGSWMQIPHSSIAEIMGQSGFDWVAIDLEHGSVSCSQLPDLFRALELGNTLPLVRLARGDEKDCKQSLDAGAGGIIIPMTETAEQLSKIIDFSRWPPAGNRGVAFSRANLFGKFFKDYMKLAQQPLIIAMIESKEGLKNLDEILKVDNLDAVLIGPYDLSASLGITAQFEHKEFINALKNIKKKADFANIPCGFHIVNPSKTDLQASLDNGYRFIPYSIDSVFLTKFSKNPFA
jgi:2-dehydro-3-deoxyglucarate aldolase